MPTEEEASKLWCPHMYQDINKGANFPSQTNIPTCLGSKCSQWRWAENEFTTLQSVSIDLPKGTHWKEALQKLKKHPEVTQWLNLGWIIGDDDSIIPPAFGGWSVRLIHPLGDSRKGYCGLSGPDNFGSKRGV